MSARASPAHNMGKNNHHVSPEGSETWPNSPQGGSSVWSINLFGIRYTTVLLMVHLNLLLYAMCFWIQNTVTPYLTRELGVNAVVFGYLQTTFAVAQLIGGPLFGRFGDVFGGRAAFSLAFTCAALSYGILGVSFSVHLLFLSRLPSVFMHVMQAGQMVVTDQSSSSMRAVALSHCGVSYAIGMVIGPMIGGFVTSYSGEHMAAMVACAGSLVSLLIVILFIPQHTKKAVDVTHTKEGSSLLDVHLLSRLFRNRITNILVVVKAIAGVPLGVFQSMFAVVVMDQFGLTAAQNGTMMSYIGVVTLFMQLTVVGWLSKRFSEVRLIVLATAILAVTYFALTFVTTIVHLCLVCAPLCLGLTVLNANINSAMTNAVHDQDTGSILGVNMAVNSLVRTVSPTIGGYLLEYYGFASFGWFGVIGCTVAMIVSQIFLSNHMPALKVIH